MQLHLPTDEEEDNIFLQIQLAGNLKGPLDYSCNRWKIREQRIWKNATRAEIVEKREKGAGGILQSNNSFAISSIWIGFIPLNTEKQMLRCFSSILAQIGSSHLEKWEKKERDEKGGSPQS